MPVSRSDLILARHAIRKNWLISHEVKQLIAKDVFAILDNEPSPRMFIAACWVVLAMAAANQRVELSALRAEQSLGQK